VWASLFNVSKHAPDSTLIVHLPPIPSRAGSPAVLPGFLRQWPVASINYRWERSSEHGPDDGFARPLSWPTPVHDVAFAYSWLVENLAPPGNGRRDIYVYGSYLGGSLAASLGLTEAHAHARFGVRGFVAYNGIYNWTMFLPDHRVNRPSGRSKTPTAPPELPEGSHLQGFHKQLSSLFQRPSNLFDPFASPSLFFHGPGLAIPQTFSMSTAELSLIDALSQHSSDSDLTPLITPSRPPRKSHLVFPPRKSTLKIPPALLLHDAPPRITETTTKSRKRKPKLVGNTFQAQAEELAELMRRSIDKVELKERIKWDEETDSWEEEAQRRVQVLELGEEGESHALSEMGEEVVINWFEGRD
jgi:acetyl esterase/lipase